MERHDVPSATPPPDPHHISVAEQEQLRRAQQTSVHTWPCALTLSPSLSRLTDADEASTLCTFASRVVSHVAS